MSRPLFSFAAMTFAEELEGVAALVERRLDELLQEDGTDSTRLTEAMRYAVLSPGKRLRPFLLIQSARLFAASEASALDAACALECLHCYSLVHDDLPAMDDDALRRGQPTVHIAFGEATAILAGDALLTLAFEILSSARVDANPAIRAQLVHSLAKVAGWQGMARGQALDLAAEGQTLRAEDVSRMQALKTGALFGLAAQAGAILGRADARARAAMSAYAAALGQAFQLADDLLDAEGDAEVLGKAVGKDEERGKATLVALLGVDAARARLAGLVAEAEAALAPFGDKAKTLIETARFIAERHA